MNWPTARLDELFEIARGGSPRPIRDFISDAPNAVNWISIKDASGTSKYIESTERKIRKEGVSKSRLVHPGDFLLSNSMSFGRPYIANLTGCIHDGWLLLRDRSGRVDQDFFFRLLGSEQVYRRFARLAAGAVVKNLNTSLVGQVEVPVPSLEEQRRIADILDRADAIRRKRRAAIALTEELLRSTFLDMFGDPVTNPNAWPHAPLSTVAQVNSGITKNRRLAPEDAEELPYMRVANVQDGYLDLSDIKTIPVPKAKVERYLLQPGDVLMTEGGDPDKLGRGTVWQGEIERCVHQNHIFSVRVDRDRVVPEFVSAQVGSERGRRYFLRASKQTTGIASINRTQLKQFPLLVPPLQKQRAFKAAVQRVGDIAAKLTAAADEADTLFHALTQRAFRGDL